MSRHLSRVATFALLVALLAATVFAEPLVDTLDNGCRVVVEEDHSRPVAALRVYVGVGSALEGRWLGAGMTHFLEHTIDQGTPTRSARDIADLIESLGNSSNAYTTHDHTCYYITTPGAMIGQAIELYADFILHPTLPATEVETQRGIILREMAMVDDDPGRVIYDLFAETMFLQHPHRYRIIGYPDAFRAVTREELVEFHRLWYVPDNMVVVVVGDVDGRQVLEKVRATFGAAPRRAPPSVELVAEPPQLAPRRRVQVKPQLQRAYLQLGWRGVTLFDEDMYPLDVLAYYLGAGESAPLVTELRDERGLVDAVGCYSNTPAYDAGSFAIWAVLDPEKLSEVEQAILARIDQLRAAPPSPADLARVLRQMRAEEVFGQESAEDRAEALGRNLMLTGDVHFTQRYLEGISRVTPERIRAAVARYCVPERLCVAALTPRLPRPARERGRSQPAEVRTVVRTLDNGLRVVVRENHSQPLVAVTAAIRGGLRCEPEGKAGITSLMANMLTRGTAGRSREQIAQAIDRAGGSLQPYAGRNSFGVQANFLAEDLPLALDLALDVLFRPTFPDDELANQKRLALAAIQARADSVESVALEALYQELYRVHPYRYMTEGTAETVAALTRQDLADFHAAWASAQGAVLAVCGDVVAEDVFARVAQLARRLPAQAVPPTAPPAEPPIDRPRERLVVRPQQQAIVAYGFHGLAVDDPDRPALDVLDAAFSGAGYPGGRLHETLRGQQLVYFAHAMPVYGLDPGPFVIYAGCAPDKVATVRGEIERLVREITSAPISDEELQRAQGMCISDQQVGLQTNASLALTMALDELYGLGADNWRDYAQRIRSVTAADVLAVARRVLDLNRCAVVVTTPQEQ